MPYHGVINEMYCIKWSKFYYTRTTEYTIHLHRDWMTSHTCDKMADIKLGDKRLDQLKVAELREHLEKRGLSKTGVKVDLVKRLSDVSFEPSLVD